jgi:FkbM family methyltransferase
MTFITYAQNFEDVLLRRALADVAEGSYLDIGAGDPEIHSVTKAFADDGWTGVNVEPLSTLHARLIENRPRDINLRAAVSDQAGSITLYEVEGYSELSTTVAEVAADLRAGGRVVVEHEVPALTLADIAAEHVTGPVHFLKIDVEGAELAVLRGADFTALRPWIIVVESVAFGRATEDATARDELLAAAGYGKVYFDGLNDFFLADEHSGRAAAFDVPVNVRDDFRAPVEGRAEVELARVAGLLGLTSFSDEHEVIERLESLRSDRIEFESEALAARAELEVAVSDRDNARADLDALQVEIDSYRQSSFERERFIAWQSAEILRIQLEVQAELTAARTHAAAANAGIAALLRSSSWRISLPLRVLRHPRPYLRKISGR